MPEKDISSMFIKNLKKLLLDNNMTYKELAEKLGVKASSVSMWMTGNSLPRMGLLDKLADLFDVSLDYLMGGTGTKESSCGMTILTTEIELIQKYRELTPHGKKMVDFTLNEEWQQSIAEQKQKVIPMMPKDDSMYVNAAHAIPGASEEDKQHDEDIMNDENF